MRTTRTATHAVAEHVLATAQRAATGRIGLRQSPGGFATRWYPHGGGRRRVAVVGTDLVVEDRTERPTESEPPRRVRDRLTTLRAAGDLAGVAPGMPGDLYAPTPPPPADEPLALDGTAAADLARALAVVRAALVVWTDAQVGHDPDPVQLWPEHFDLATAVAEVNYGGSPGDDAHDLPYLYVGPWTPPPAGSSPFWNEPFGASVPLTELGGVDDAVAFFAEGRDRSRTPG